MNEPNTPLRDKYMKYGNYDKSLKSKSDFFNSCITNKENKAIGFTRTGFLLNVNIFLNI
ncbi:MAG: hypothetical protein ACI9TY_000838 [Alphaproteobacteria bacterium]|jgi:hypothetical protein